MASSTGPREIATHCPYCALQCGMSLREPETTEGTAVVSVLPRGGGLCQKGWTAADLLAHPDRLITPLARAHKGAQLVPAGWSYSLDRVADQIRQIQQEYGPDAVAVFGGGGLTNEKAYALGKFARVALRTRNIDYNGRFCMSSAAAAGNRSFGVDRGLPFPMSDLADAEVIVLVGSNPAETMPPFVKYLNEQRARGGTLIVIDPRQTPTAKNADLHLQPTPGTDLAIANALLHILITEGMVDQDYVDQRTSGFEQVRTVVIEGYWPARVERESGVSIDDLYTVARRLAAARSVMILTARGAEQHATGTDTVSAYINLALALGLPGRAASGYGCLTGQGNGQGGREHGQKADQLPGYRRLDDPLARAHVAAVWGVDVDSLPGPGPSAYELLDSLGTDGGPKALLIFGSNPVVSGPNARRIEAALRRLDLLVVADCLPSETANLADVVFPVAQWAEEEGTMTNLEGRVLRRRALRKPPHGLGTDLAVITELATRLGHGARFTADPRAVFEELRRASQGGPADYAGITYERLDAGEELYWPCPTTDHPGTPRLFIDGFPTVDGRARFVPVDHRGAAEQPCQTYPLYLTTGRVLSQYQSGTQTRRVDALTRVSPQAFVELHPDLAARLEIIDGEPVLVTSRRGDMVAPARITDTIRPDTVFAPFHWAGAGRVNSVTGDALDPVSKMPEFKVCAVNVSRVAT
jgi:assimilatory nitrate reductase catalytic subunit